jgi:hypothetical protein
MQRNLLDSLPLDCAGNLAAAEATGAYVDTPGGTVHYGFNALYIRFPCTIGTAVGVADLDAECNALIANFTLCHLALHLLASKLNKQPYNNNRTREEMQVIFSFADVFSRVLKSVAKCDRIV